MRALMIAMIVWASCETAPEPHACRGECGGKQATLVSYERSAFAVDLLLVVDPRLAADPRLLELAGAFAQRRYDLHLGVVGPGGGSPGRVLPAADTTARCGVPGIEHLVSTPTCGKGQNFSGDLTPLLACLANAPLPGSNQPLEAMRVALSGAAGFRRPDAIPWVVIVSDGDDGSPDSVASYVSFLQALSPRWSALSIVAPAGAARLTQLADLTSEAALVDRDGDWRAVLDAYRPVGLWFNCLPPNLRDLDPAAPGVQPECVIEEGSLEARQTLLACREGGARPCYRLVPADQCESGVSLVVDRGGCSPPAETFVVATCAIDR